MRRYLLAFLTGAILGGLLEIPYLPVWAQSSAPTIVIPPDFPDGGYICAAYRDRQAACRYAGDVRRFLGQR